MVGFLFFLPSFSAMSPFLPFSLSLAFPHIPCPIIFPSLCSLSFSHSCPLIPSYSIFSSFPQPFPLLLILFSPMPPHHFPFHFLPFPQPFPLLLIPLLFPPVSPHLFLFHFLPFSFPHSLSHHLSLLVPSLLLPPLPPHLFPFHFPPFLPHNPLLSPFPLLLSSLCPHPCR